MHLNDPTINTESFLYGMLLIFVNESNTDPNDDYILIKVIVFQLYSITLGKCQLVRAYRKNLIGVTALQMLQAKCA